MIDNMFMQHTCTMPRDIYIVSVSSDYKAFVLAVALFDMPNLNRFDILSISIFCKIALSISISIFSKITISISISISIFLELPYRYRYFSELPYRYRYRYFSKVSIYRQLICHIDISNRAKIGGMNIKHSLNMPIPQFKQKR